MNRPFALITGASSWNRRGVGRDLRTRREKHNAADVARVGFDAMMRGDGDVVSGWKNKLQAAIANITPAGALAEQHHKMAEPGSGARARTRGASPMASATAARRRSLPENTPRRVSVPVDGTALLLIDVINDLAFEGSESLVEQAEPMAARLGRLKRRATQAGVPAIYINDNFGQWRSDFRQTFAHCTSPRAPGRRVSQRLRPGQRDYFVLKPKHSGFFDTTLDTLLGALKIRRVIVTGIAGNICVLFTANDAYMRDLKIFAPADCIVSNTAAENDHALRQIRTVLKGNITDSVRLNFRRGRRVASARGRRNEESKT